MKKLLLLTMLAAAFQMVQAQDFKKVQTTVILKKWEDAKTEIDKVMADPKAQNKDGYFWKARIYSALYADPALMAKYPNAAKEADEAFKKYRELDPSLAFAKTQGPDGYFDMYKTSFSEAIKVFNQKKWEDAAANFKMAVDYSDVIFTNKWTSGNYAFDTTSLLYLGYSYQNATKMNEAATYYGRLADAKVGGETYVDVYKFLLSHYTTAKDEAKFNKYLAIGKELYPKDAAWEEFEMDYVDKNLSLAQKTAIYDKEDPAGTLSESKYLQFGDLFVHVKDKEKSLDSAQALGYTLKAADAFKKAYAKNNQNSVAAFNVGVIYYNIYGDYDDKYAANIRAMQAINANKPPADKDPKKKAAQDAKFKADTDVIKNANTAIEKPLMDNLDLAIEWLEKSYTALKSKAEKSKTEKSIANKSVDFLANLYAYKRDRVRGKDLKAFDAYDAKYKEFDALHGKF